MSLTQAATLTCPMCLESIEVDLWDSINADRRPDLREQVLQRSLHRFTCECCDSEIRVPPSLVYLDMKRRQIVLTHPISQLADWRGAVADAKNTLASGLEALVTDDMSIRVVFGWAALREQLVLREAGLDPLDVEVLKLAILRRSEELTIQDDLELRLVHADAHKWTLAWVHADSELPEDFLEVTPDVVASVAPSSEAWSAVREELDSELYADLNRLLVA